MAIFFKRNCLYKYERYKRPEKKVKHHLHIRDIRETKLNHKLKNLLIYFTSFTSHTSQ